MNNLLCFKIHKAHIIEFCSLVARTKFIRTTECTLQALENNTDEPQNFSNHALMSRLMTLGGVV